MIKILAKLSEISFIINEVFANNFINLFPIFIIENTFFSVSATSDNLEF